MTITQERTTTGIIDDQGQDLFEYDADTDAQNIDELTLLDSGTGRPADTAEGDADSADDFLDRDLGRTNAMESVNSSTPGTEADADEAETKENPSG